jgi:DNA polymerase-1
MKKKLLIIDLSNFIFRAFYAIRPLHAPNGTPVNAVYGVLTMLTKMIDEHKPTHLLIARDSKEESFRKTMYPEYKANRTEPPNELIPQFSLVEELMKKLHFPMWAQPGFEADDLIGSVVTQFQNSFDEIHIASGDKDLMQFVNDKVKILDTMKDKLYGAAEVTEKMGVKPDQIVDYLSLIGDSSDNIPGVDGIGPKGASNLLSEFGDLKTIYENLEKIKNKKLIEKLVNGKDSAYLSQRLVQIKLDMEIPYNVEKLQYALSFDQEMVDFISQLGFKSLVQKYQLKVKATEINETINYKSIKTEDDFTDLLASFGKQVSIYFQMQDELDQLSSNLFYIIASGEELFVWKDGDSDLTEKQVLEIICSYRGEILSFNIKKLLQRLMTFNLSWKFQFFDIIQAHFVLHPDQRHSLEDIALETLGSVVEIPLVDPTSMDFFNDFNKLVSFTQSMSKIGLNLKSKLDLDGSRNAFNEIDIPLIEILAAIELEGVCLDSAFYKTLENEFSIELSNIEKAVKDTAQCDLNLKSPKQVGELLFDKLNLPVIRKTKTGYSTDADVLAELNAMNLNPIPGMLLKYRELDKLLSTYVKTLPEMVNPKTHKIHTHYNLSNAATGRLSSDNPNLQNIPVRTENGRKLRKGFIPSKGNILLSADYSQVELRILAHFSQDPNMLLAFKENKDIHQQTASEIFEIPLDKVTKEQRNSAKAINFGLMYGQSSFGLSQTLKISQADAKKYITNYFLKFSKVKSYLDSLKEFGEAHGFVETMFGRRRHLPEINSEQRQVKAMAERIAINSPIQGTAADIIKVAMKNIYLEFIKQNFKSKMILQVHDELIFDVVPNELDLVKSVVSNLMETSVPLLVPLKVDMGSGLNWYDLK